MKERMKNNQGVALITVVIGVMFCLLLSSTMLRVSLLGLQSRAVNNEMSNTFYDAESVVDSVKMNLQSLAAKAWAESDHSSGTSDAYLQRAFFLLTGKSDTLAKNGYIELTSKQYNQAIEKLQTDGTIVGGGEVVSFEGISRSLNGEGILDGIIISNVQVSYKDPKTGNVSYLKTDIKIGAPVYASDKSYPVGSYSMFAGAGLKLTNENGKTEFQQPDGLNQLGYLEQHGNVYIGYEKLNSLTSATAVRITKANTFILSGDSTVINGDILCTGQSNIQLTGENVEIRGMILLGPGSHLIISKNTNILCKDIRIFNSDYDVSSTATSGYQSIADKSFSFELAKARTYSEGLPYNYYKKYSNWTSYPYFKKDGQTYSDGGNKASIVYLDSDGKCYDALVNAGSISTQGGELLSKVGGITVNMSDAKLNPVPNKSYANSGNLLYDEVFASVIDTAYFYNWMYKVSEFQNPKVEGILEDKSYTVNKDGSFNASNATVNNGPGDKGPTTFTYAAGKNLSTSCLFYPKTSADLVNVNGNVFYVTSGDVRINVDSNTSTYTGIIITTGNVYVKKDTGYCTGKSLLQMDTTSDHKFLKEYVDTVGKYVGIKDKKQETLFNNLFKGGIKSLYQDVSSSSKGYVVNTEVNSQLELIETYNFDKQ